MQYALHLLRTEGMRHADALRLEAPAEDRGVLFELRVQHLRVVGVSCQGAGGQVVASVVGGSPGEAGRQAGSEGTALWAVRPSARAARAMNPHPLRGPRYDGGPACRVRVKAGGSGRGVGTRWVAGRGRSYRNGCGLIPTMGRTRILRVVHSPRPTPEAPGGAAGGGTTWRLPSSASAVGRSTAGEEPMRDGGGDRLSVRVQCARIGTRER